MSKEKKYIPKRRFKEFQNGDAWEQRKLGDEVDIIGTGKSKFTTDFQKTEGKPYAVLGSTSVIRYDDEYDYSGEFVLTARVGANAGDLYRYSGNVKISDNTVFLQGKNLDFIFFSLKKFNLKNLAFGTGQPLIKASELNNLDLIFPNQVEEKKQIGVFFNNLDNLITLHQRKLEKMKSIKAAYLTEMFPQEGESVPKRRFAGFTDAWEQRKLSEEMSEFIVPMRDKPKEFGGKIPWTRIEDIEGKYLNDSLSGQYVTEGTINQMNLKIIPKNSLIVSSSATFGVVAVVTQDLITNQTFIGLVPNDKETLDYWYSYFHSSEARKYMKLQSAGSTIFYIARECFENMPVNVPSKVEMVRIGNYFDNLDNLLTLHQRKLDKLLNIKKAYLNEMFI